MDRYKVTAPVTAENLTPIDLTDRKWEASPYNGDVIARADSEEAARARAQATFAIATLLVPGERVKVAPWKYPDLVHCQRLTDSAYSEEGPEAILSPEHGENALR